MNNLINKYTIQSKDSIDTKIVESLYSPKTMKVYNNKRIETTFKIASKKNILINSIR